MLNVGIIGFGHWGPNHVRVINESQDAQVLMISDLDKERRSAAHKLYPSLAITDSTDNVINSDNVDAVIISTPVATHHSLAKAALRAGKHVLLEKPFCKTVAEADELVALSKQERRTLMCGHVFLFNEGLRQLRDYIYDGVIGTVHYMAATRTNLGPLRSDTNSLYDLACHDISIFSFLLGELPINANAVGKDFLQPNIADVVFGTLSYPTGAVCHFHDSWLNPRKERTLVVVGDKKMAVWDDMNVSEPIRLYDKGLIQEPYYDTFGEFQLAVRDNDVLIPKIKSSEPLKVQDHHFIDSIRKNHKPLSDADFARNIVHILQSLQNSIDHEGRREQIEWNDKAELVHNSNER